MAQAIGKARALTGHLPKNPTKGDDAVVTYGPYPLPHGTITKIQQKEIKEKTWATVWNRNIGRGREFGVVGAPGWAEWAYQLALEAIEQNGEDGGRKTQAQQEAQRDLEKAKQQQLKRSKKNNNQTLPPKKGKGTPNFGPAYWGTGSL